MLTEAILQEAITTLSSFTGKTKKDPNFNQYKKGIEDQLIGFIIHCKKLPLSQQLEYIAKEMHDIPGNKENMSAKIEDSSGKNRTWTLMFALAALAIERKHDLAPGHPEIAPIDKLLSGLSNGWVNKFASIRLGLKLNNDAINNLLEGMKGWIQKYDIKQDKESTHEVLLALYAAACALEQKLASSSMVPERFPPLMLDIKNLIANKFNELKQQLNQESRHDKPPTPVSGALMPLLPKNEVLYRQFKEQLVLLKIQQEQIQQKIHNFSQEKLDRLNELQLLVNAHEINEKNKMSQFWKKYDTSEKFNQLMADLNVPQQERPSWQQYFNYQHGSYLQQAAATFWTGSWGPSTKWGGIASDTISLKVLISKSDAVIKPLQDISTLIKKQISTDDKKSSRLIEEIEKELKNLADLKKVTLDSLGEHLHSIMEHKKSNTLEKINSDIEEFKRNLEKQKVMVKSLKEIHEKIETLKNLVDCPEVEKAFALFLNEAINTISYTKAPFPSDLPTAEKFIALDKSLTRAADNVQGLQLSLNHMVEASTDQAKSMQKESVIQLVTQFVESKENTWGHTLLSIFSSSYRTLFDALKSTLEEKSPEIKFNKVKEVLGITDKPSQKKEIAGQFKKLKEKAEETLSDKIPVYGNNS